MLVQRCMRLRCKQIVAACSFATIILIIVLYNIVYRDATNDLLKDTAFLELRTCPACFGRGLCPLFQNGHFRFTGISKYSTMHRFNIKNVYYAEMKQHSRKYNKKVVLKKLGHDTELQAADEKICKMARKPSSCHPGSALFTYAFRPNDPILTPENTKGLSDLVSCPSDRLMTKMMNTFPGLEEGPILHSERLIIFMTLLVNPEPILLQMFNRDNGWPFPRYLGACGRWVVVENAGTELGEFYHAPWQKRLQLAYQIFQIADQFTENDDDWALYFTDINYDNYVVTDEGEVLVIDVENIIVVDKRQVRSEKPNGWDEPLVSNFDKCSRFGDCLSFDTSALCSHDKSDFNYYAVCRDLLSSYASDGVHPKNFLHDLPGEIEEEYKITHLLDECAKPTKGVGRFKLKVEILETMKTVIGLHPTPGSSV